MDVLTKAYAERDRLIGELSKIQDFILMAGRLKSSDQPAKSRRPNTSEIIDVAEQAIVQADRPLTRYEIIDYLEANGIEIKSPNKPNYVGTILWRSDRFVHNGTGYVIADRPPG